MTFTKSISFADHLHPYIESYHAEGRSVSALASRLFTEYFTGTSGIAGGGGVAGVDGCGVTGRSGEEGEMSRKLAGIRYTLIQQDLDRVRASLEAIEEELDRTSTTFRAAAEQRAIEKEQQETLLLDEIRQEFADITGDTGTHGAAGAGAGGVGAGAGGGVGAGAGADPHSRRKMAVRYRSWARDLYLEGSDPISIINHRIAAVATRTGRPAAEVREVLYQHLPGIEEVK